MSAMLSQTLSAGLESYQIGPKIRALRLKKNLGLVQLGQHTGMSSGMLSKIERGQLFSNASDAAQDRHGLRRWPRAFLR